MPSDLEVSRTVDLGGGSVSITGPAAFSLRSGSLVCWGAELTAGKKYEIPEGATFRCEVHSDSSIELLRGSEGQIERSENTLVPKGWERAAEAAANDKRPLLFLGLGGGSEFELMTFVANKLYLKRQRVGVIDGELKRPRLSPPASLGLVVLNEPLLGFSGVRATSLAYIGEYHPAGGENAADEILDLMAAAAKRQGVQKFLLYLPEWFAFKKGRSTSSFSKNFLRGVTAVVPRDLPGAHPIRKLFGKNALLEFDRPNWSPTAEGSSRERLYARYYSNRRFLMLPFHRVRTERSRFLTGKRLPKSTVEKIVYAEKFANGKSSAAQVFVTSPLSTSETARTKKDFSVRKLYEVRAGTEAGVQVGLCNARGETLELGIVENIDFEGRYIQVWTPLAIGKEADVELVRFSRIRLAPDGKELAPTAAEAI